MEQIAELAEKEAKTPEFWYRQHYRLPVTDPRFQQVTTQHVLVEYEAWLAFNGAEKKKCPRCGKHTFRDRCPYCQGADKPVLTDDDKINEVMEMYTRGQSPDLDAIFGNSGKDEFIPLKPGEQ